MTILVTGGAGFIGSNFILDWLQGSNERVINLDKLTYAGNQMNLASLNGDARHIFIQGDINDSNLVSDLLLTHRIRAIIHFAAESHVDRSILEPGAFIQTNIVGTFNLLDAAQRYWSELTGDDKDAFRFIHISTDEVFGSLEHEAPAFTESSRYEPNSPYSASKAASDHLVRAYHQTYGLPAMITHCSNNYGPYQFPEKLIPLCIQHALENRPIPVYGNGLQIRDWLHVSDHCRAIRILLAEGKAGDQYNIGGWNEKTNIDVITTLCSLLDQQMPRHDGLSYAKQITSVTDRPGHDRRYAIDASNIALDLDWKPLHTFESGIQQTLQWYLDNQDWISHVVQGDYRIAASKQEHA